MGGAEGTGVPGGDVNQVDTYRQLFEGFYANASSNNATADTTLKRSLKLSLFPAVGVLTGATGTATLTLATPPAADMTIHLQAPKRHAQLPASGASPETATPASLPLTC